jgi:putative PLP-dependent aminotransferase (TIGR04422 family)
MISFWMNSTNKLSLTSVPSYRIESYLQTLFPNTHPVLFSSVRSGMNSILLHEEAKRSDLIFVPPYSPHCVFDSITRISTPTTDVNQKVKISFEYYPYGFNFCSNQSAEIIVKDRADSFLTSNYNFFEGKSKFEMVSLVKILGTSSGGVIFCSSDKDAQSLINIRNSRNNKISNINVFFKRTPSLAPYWQGTESISGSVSRFDTQNIWNLLKQYPAIEKIRKDNFELFKDFDLPEIAVGVIPTSIPVSSTDHNLELLKKNKISTETRMFNYSSIENPIDFKNILPLPIHQELTFSTLESIAKNLK